MFATLAPRLRDNGWASGIPVANPGKRPLIFGWQAYNCGAPTEVEVDLWCSAHPCAGIGLAYGPDRVLGVDLDFLEPAAVALDRFDRREQTARQKAIMSGLRWARREIGPDATTIAASIRSSDMFARWKARWRRHA